MLWFILIFKLKTIIADEIFILILLGYTFLSVLCIPYLPVNSDVELWVLNLEYQIQNFESQLSIFELAVL